MAYDRARYEAVRLLIRCTDQGGYSNILVRTALPDTLSERDRDFSVYLFYGTLERLYTLDRLTEAFLSRPLASLDREVRGILRVSAFQILFCDTVPDAAAVNEGVALARAFKKSSAAGFVNAVLRKLSAQKETLLRRLEEDTPQGRALRYGCPPGLVGELAADHGPLGEWFLENSFQKPPVFLRVNTLKTTDRALIGRLAGEGVTARETALPHCLVAENLSDLSRLPSHQEGLFHVEDLSAQLCCAVLDAHPGQRVLDVCAAPGGKTFTAAQEMENSGVLTACDLHENRLKALENGAVRLGLACVETLTADGREYRPELGNRDRVLCDVPCSGLGVLRRRPELKQRDRADFAVLPDVQLAILNNAARYVKPGGRLVYSTCTLRRAENERVVKQFLAVNPGLFEPEPFTLPYFGQTDGALTLLSRDYGGDGFFIAALRRVR